jgi:hypothetical protein
MELNIVLYQMIKTKFGKDFALNHLEVFMKKKAYSSDKKIIILREHLENNVSISEL